MTTAFAFGDVLHIGENGSGIRSRDIIGVIYGWAVKGWRRVKFPRFRSWASVRLECGRGTQKGKGTDQVERREDRLSATVPPSSTIDSGTWR